MIDEIANPRPVLQGETYDGTVVKTTTFGAFVNLVPLADGLVHISKLGKGKRLSSVEEGGPGGRHAHGPRRGHRRPGQDQPQPTGPEWEAPEGEGSSGGERRSRRPREPREPRNRADRGPRRTGTPVPRRRRGPRPKAERSGGGQWGSSEPSSPRGCESSRSGCPASAPCPSGCSPDPATSLGDRRLEPLPRAPALQGNETRSARGRGGLRCRRAAT